MATETVEPTIHEHEPISNPIVVPKVQPAKSGDVTPSSVPDTESTTTKYSTISSEEDFSSPDLGQPNRDLQLDDFELIKTLGTGMSRQCAGRLTESAIEIGTDLSIWLGTFARVWLTRLKNNPKKDDVYALKVLRKADGMSIDLISKLNRTNQDTCSDQAQASRTCSQ